MIRDQAAAPDKADEEHDIDRGRLFLRRVADEMRYWEFMTHDEKHARILLKIRDVGTRDTLALVRTLDAKMAQLFPPDRGLSTR